MARQRLVKPDIFQHEDLHRAEMVSGLPLRLAFIGLWTQCDRRGCFMWKPGTLKLNVLPFDDVDFGAVLSALLTHGFVRSYVVDGKRFGQVPTLPLHQTFNINEKPNPLIPDPPKNGAGTVPAPEQHSASTPGTGTGTGTSAGAVATRELTPAQRLVIAANKTTNDKFGEQTRPLLPGHAGTSHLVDAVNAAGIPIDFAERSVARQVGKLTAPVKTMAYFRAGILDDWASHNANAAAGSALRILPLDRSARNETRVPPRGPSPPVPDDGVVCRSCGARETHIVNRRIVPKHLDGCVLATATAQVAQ